MSGFSSEFSFGSEFSELRVWSLRVYGSGLSGL